MRFKDPYRPGSPELLRTLDNWDSLMSFRVRLIACGGTALTLLEIKESTKDIDFIVPIRKEFERLMEFLSKIGYREGEGGLLHPADSFFIYQFWCGNRVYTTELLESPLEVGKHILIKKWRHIYLGALNLLDLIITKMFRGTRLDLDDCIAVFQTGRVNADALFNRYRECASYAINTAKMMQNFIVFSEELLQRKLVSNDFLEKVRARQ